MGLSSQREIFKVSNLKPRKPNRVSIQNGKHLYDADLSFQGQETQHSTHALHTYVAAINPPLARKLIETYIPEDENILDPFSGGGGVLVEAMLSGRSSAGAEVNPLGVIIAKAKTTHISKDQILQVGEQIINEAREIINIDLSKRDPKIVFWFKDKNLEEILSISQALENQEVDMSLKNLFRAVLSATIRDVMLTYRGEVRLRKLQGSHYDKFNPDTFEAFKKRYVLAADRVSGLPKDIQADIDLRDVRTLPFRDREFYGIITSPPYADDKNGVGYFQFSKNMLAFLGFSPEQIKECRSKFLGMTIKGKMPPQSRSLLKSLENVRKEKPEKYAEGVAFYHDYAEGLAEMARVVRERIIIVIGNRVLARTEFDNAAITVELFKNLGVDLEHHYTRELTKKRIPNLGGDGGGINLEHVLVFKK